MIFSMLGPWKFEHYNIQDGGRPPFWKSKIVPILYDFQTLHFPGLRSRLPTPPGVCSKCSSPFPAPLLAGTRCPEVVLPSWGRSPPGGFPPLRLLLGHLGLLTRCRRLSDPTALVSCRPPMSSSCSLSCSILLLPAHHVHIAFLFFDRLITRIHSSPSFILISFALMLKNINFFYHFIVIGWLILFFVGYNTILNLHGVRQLQTRKLCCRKDYRAMCALSVNPTIRTWFAARVHL